MQAFVAGWPSPFTLIGQQWWHVANKGELRHFIRTLVPKSLWHSLPLPQRGITKPAHMLLLKQALINRRSGKKRAICGALEWLGDHALSWDAIKMAFPLTPDQPLADKIRGLQHLFFLFRPPPPTPCLPSTRSAAVGDATKAETKTKTKTKSQASAPPFQSFGQTRPKTPALSQTSR